MKQKIFFVAIILAIFLQSCTTIDVTEKDAFDVKKTINSDFFEDHSYNMEKTTFASGDRELEAWHITHPDNEKTILYMGGNGFLMQISKHIIPNLIKNKVNLFVFNYSGYGNNSGEPSIAGIKQDGDAAYRFLREEKGLAPKNIILHGHSLGSMVATYVASKYEASGLVMESPVTDARDMADRLVPWFLSIFVKFDIGDALKQESNIDRIEQVDIPVLFVAGKEDKITPPEMAEVLYEKASQEKYLKIIEDGGHNDLPEKEKYRQALADFYLSLD